MNHLLRQVNITSMAAIYLPRKISGDEMSINFGRKDSKNQSRLSH